VTHTSDIPSAGSGRLRALLVAQLDVAFAV